MRVEPFLIRQNSGQHDDKQIIKSTTIPYYQRKSASNSPAYVEILRRESFDHFINSVRSLPNQKLHNESNSFICSKSITNLAQR